MSDNKIMGALFLIVAAFGIYLHSQGKLMPSLSILVGPDLDAKGQPSKDLANKVTLGQFIMALAVLLFLLSMLSPHNGTTLTVLIIMGALLVNRQRMGKDDLISTLLT